MAKKEMKTMTYGNMPLKVQIKQGLFINQSVEIKAILDTKTGEVTFRISNEDLQKINESES
ncbi:hypothetical protein O0I26_07505 [Staphylococcus pseudintermedius]|uniref:hypothetical protein n=1 Tax=Staphylococcus pseudintermedius TaxID=283734 RepID=UPI000D7367A6|nr:hypothetical protein [Staphylococcus pseudintermedius]EGQ1665072.1 hypothetical protein [Staphylococcus pseudintermedius]EGQ1789096.1 hypothetical protein [Staphylococcus pseudintermedius]EGQ2810858.1 hypothetical protein [Staphylococcus pseudintermedius]EGQ3052464.1 hypothetical protein [Staphylococcus pseudintermedius]EGQ3795889.1 hypothetical protein [Staphylococcus pseudintermedius]